MSLTQSTALLGPLFLARRLGINVLSALGAAPATNDLLPLYDTDAGSNKSVTVANLTSAVGSGLGLSGLVDNSVIRANGTTGLQGSGLSIDDSDNLTMPNGTTLAVDIIAESTAAAGVTIDGVPVKDGEIAYNYLGSPTASKTWSIGPHDLQWNFTAAGGTWKYDWLGNASGHLFELMQETGNVTAGTHLLHVEANDADALSGHFQHNDAAGEALRVTINSVDVLSVAGSTATITGNLTVTGQIDVAGGAFIHNATDISTEDPLVRYALDNTADVLDIGWVGEYDNGTTAKYTGMFRDATDGKYRLFSGLQAEPTTTVNIAGTGYAAATLVANLEVPGSATFAGATIANLGTVTTADINGGTIDGTTIGASDAATVRATTLTLTSTSVNSSVSSQGGASFGLGVTSPVMRAVNSSGSSAELFSNGASQAAMRLFCSNVRRVQITADSTSNILGVATFDAAGTLIDTALSIPINSASAISTPRSFTAAGITVSGTNNLTMNGGTLETGGGSIASSSGTVSVSNHINLAASQTLRVNGTQVVTAQQSAISAPSGGTTIDTEARTAIGSILTALRTHGLIAT